MATLILKFKGQEIGRSPVSKSEVTIGRDATCDLVIDNAGVSRVHAVIDLEGKTFRVRDGGSSNGTMLNGARIGDEPRAVKEGDEILVGKHVVVFSEQGGGPVAAAADGGAQTARDVRKTFQMSSVQALKMAEQWKQQKAGGPAPGAPIPGSHPAVQATGGLSALPVIAIACGVLLIVGALAFVLFAR